MAATGMFPPFVSNPGGSLPIRAAFANHAWPRCTD
tara:strand:- start:514 stop:618 length:105 start_codon:yes stop_codon:yes gene_type:complete